MNKVKNIAAVLIAVAGLGFQQAQASLDAGTIVSFNHELTPAEELAFIIHTGQPSNTELLAKLLADGPNEGPFAGDVMKIVISGDKWNISWNFSNTGIT